ncbi:helix-turn-helix domain-containing protein [Micromonospora sp. NBC_01655]|uniref:helix-turn-helix domain-containing protein n=1 Tax=Micromonospora sp. NBC_01655 TaxID=2975983 RepID=UPI00225B65BF|nr:helix-turn-helix transcriptional regulator [Micromonospora sp. NBC_01655]MCX4473597.1 helix-turn-helix domain-containing protein [Micromonospora sp. NBC_01655]
MGDRIRARRELRGWSIRHAASRAGISHTSWSRIERGQQRTDRYMVVDLAAALECSVVDLTGQPYTPADRQLDAARIDAERVWRIMMDTPMAARRGVPATVEQVRREAGLVRALYGRCDYAGALRRLVDLVPALHGLIDRRAALVEMVPVYGVAMGSLLNVSYPAHAWLAAERCAEAAGLLDDPVAAGVAAANRARVSAYSGAYGPARALCDSAGADLAGSGADGALDVLGFLYLARAHHLAGLHDQASAENHLAEAARIAAHTGETESWDLAWGPRNVALWRMAFQLDTGRPEAAMQTAAGVELAGLPAVRQVYFWLDMGRAAEAVGRDRDAVRMLLAAERVGPQHARSSTSARETVRSLLRRGATSPELRGLCERMSMTAQ